MKRDFKIFLVYMMAALMVNCGPTRPYQMTNFFVSDAITKLRAKRVAVLPFENLSKVPGASQVVTDEFNLQLGKTGIFNLVERIRIKELYKEQDFDPDRIDETTAVKIGKMLGAHAVVLGEVTRYIPYETSVTPKTSQASSSSSSVVIHTDDDDEGDLSTFWTVISVISVVGLIYLLFKPKPSAEVGSTVRMINVETGEFLWQAKDTFLGRRKSVQALVEDKESKKRLIKDVEFLNRILCEQLAGTLKENVYSTY